ncbi:MAG TPA: protein kinase, partial [Kofleriaceae bacterium]|nr:protein kinase [Kofleriaceae bacterium]
LGEPMPVSQACFVVMKLCEGLDYAHNKRDQAGREVHLVHRDVSPQNVLVSFEGEVKIIDFGIAKAAGKGSKTQAGILKGKFGYMSPEQVRGIPIDRRSDVFSCGIVLYELLTGERLFVGESDFSTLEKVRNVEILPPTTYNRRIPDELERIVLKALAKDPEERYQNAIDLHDELQAFVYTAGEFYSRKDLAGWMKRTFGKEIEEETAKLESYRQLRPPMPSGPGAPAVPPPIPAAAVSTPSGPVAAPPATPGVGLAPTVIAPPPPPLAPSVATAAATAPAAPVASPLAPPTLAHGSLDPDAGLPVPSLADNEPTDAAAPPLSDAIPEPAPAVSRVSTANRSGGRRPPTQPVTRPPQAPSRSQPVPVVAQPSAHAGPRLGKGRHRPTDAGWDDDDVETRLYDEDAKHKSKRNNLPLQPPVSSSPGISLPEPAPPRAADLAALARAPATSDRAGRGWDPLASTDSFPEMVVQHGHPAMHNGGSGPAQFPAGSNDVPSPLRQDPTFDPTFDLRARGDSAAIPSGLGSLGRERSSAHRAQAVAARPDAPYDPMASFGARFAAARSGPDRRVLVMIILGSATVAAIVVIAVILLSGGGKQVAQPAPAPPPVAKAPAVAVADPSTGFDLYVTPAGMTQWKLDGESRTDRLPSRIRGIAAGTHTVQIEPPPGFMSQFQKVNVEPGKAPKVEIVLQPIPGLTGRFESSPPGATVSLIVDGKRQPVGPSPAKAPLDPRSTYQVLFEKPGYVSVNRPIAFTGIAEERISVTLEKVPADKPPAPAAPVDKAAPAAPPPAPPRKAARPSEKPVDKSAEVAAAADAPAREPAAADDSKAKGILVLGSKPPCEIAIDGSPTGLHTPQTEIKLAVGRHRITLINSEFGIKESFNVDIKADAPEKMIKDYSDRLPSQ